MTFPIYKLAILRRFFYKWPIHFISLLLNFCLQKQEFKSRKIYRVNVIFEEQIYAYVAYHIDIFHATLQY
jgi:hypothetical protein